MRDEPICSLRHLRTELDVLRWQRQGVENSIMIDSAWASLAPTIMPIRRDIKRLDRRLDVSI